MKVKTSRVLTLSSYDKGHQRVDGEASENPSFGESLSPITFMLGAFKGLPTGTKIKVTMEMVEKEQDE